MSLRVPDDHEAGPDQERFTTEADHPVDAATSRLDELRWRYSDATTEMLLRALIQNEFCGRLAVVSSFGAESAVLLALIAEIDPGVPILFLDTGKLFGETLRYRDTLTAALGLTDVRTLHPSSEHLAAGDADGMLWLNDPDRCCALRKVVPLASALHGFAAWMSGRKRYQGAARAALPLFEADGAGRIKVNPLAGWSRARIEAVFAARKLPPHPLVKEGYRSIGCMTCTDRASPGEDPRAGRWRGLGKTECGIHSNLLSRPAPPRTRGTEVQAEASNDREVNMASLAAARSSGSPGSDISSQRQATRPPAIAVIGAGFSGTLLALHLLQRCPPSVRVHLIERSPQFGRGLAYSTGNPNHVLNVPAGRMSAFHDRPDDFFQWLQQNPDSRSMPITPASFVSRSVFGDYIRHLLNAEFRRAAGRGGRLVLTRGEVRDLRTSRGGIVLDLDRERRLEADLAVLAVGNFPPEPPPIADPSFYDSQDYRSDPWAPAALSDLDPQAPVLLVGTGLTMVDTAISLFDRGHTGAIHALSRRGLLPRRHGTGAATAAVALIERPLPIAAAGLTRLLREEVEELAGQGRDWRAVIDGLRPATQDIWQAMPANEKARFIRHLRPWWEVHRHRVPAAVSDRIEAAITRGQLVTGATRIRAMQAKDGGVLVTHRPRRAAADHHLRVERVINCSGPGCDYDRIADPLIRSLLDRGDIRPDPLRLGLDVSSVCALRNRQGEIWQRLYAVGPVTKPLFWEVTSVPDIRRQCEALASLLSARLAPILPANGGIIAPTLERATHNSAWQDHPSKSRDPVATDVFLW